MMSRVALSRTRSWSTTPIQWWRSNAFGHATISETVTSFSPICRARTSDLPITGAVTTIPRGLNNVKTQFPI